MLKELAIEIWHGASKSTIKFWKKSENDSDEIQLENPKWDSESEENEERRKLKEKGGVQVDVRNFG